MRLSFTTGYCLSIHYCLYDVSHLLSGRNHSCLTICLSLSLPQGPGQEAGPGNADPSLSQVYAPPPSYPPPGQGPPSVAGRLPPLDFSPAHAGAEYQEHAQLRVYQGPQHEGADLGPSNVVRLHMLQRVLPLSLLQDHSDELK